MELIQVISNEFLKLENGFESHNKNLCCLNSILQILSSIPEFWARLGQTTLELLLKDLILRVSDSIKFENF